MGDVQKWVKRQWERLLGIAAHPHEIGRGVAVGIFFGFTPLFGLKTLLSLAGAWIVRGNVLAAVVAVTLHDVLLPLWPILLVAEYEAGAWLMRLAGADLPPMSVVQLAPERLVQWTTFFSVGFPLLLGSLLIGLPSALAAGWLTVSVIRRRASAGNGDGV